MDVSECSAENSFVIHTKSGNKLSYGELAEEASKITTPEGVVSYEAEVKKGKEEMDLIFDANGTFLKKETEAHDDKDKN